MRGIKVHNVRALIHRLSLYMMVTCMQQMVEKIKLTCRRRRLRLEQNRCLNNFKYEYSSSSLSAHFFFLLIMKLLLLLCAFSESEGVDCRSLSGVNWVRENFESENLWRWIWVAEKNEAWSRDCEGSIQFIE